MSNIATPNESQVFRHLLYAMEMPKRSENLTGWGKRLRDHLEDSGSSMDELAEKVGRHSSSIRSWTNGNRQINLSEFLTLCEKAKADPAVILFGRPVMTEAMHQKIIELTAEMKPAPVQVRAVKRGVKSPA